MSKKTLMDAYRFEGFRNESVVKGFFGDPKAMVIVLKRRSKKVSVLVVIRNAASTIVRSEQLVIFLVAIGECISNLRSVVFLANGVVL